MRVSLGRCLASQGEIRIAQFLLSGPPGLLEEVLCHEVSHAAATARFGGRIRPHGSEWRGLMRDAGFEPRTRIPDTELPHDTLAATRRRVFWQHRCPICEASRIAGRPVRGWRCAKCLASGLGGQLAIRRGDTARSALLTACPQEDRMPFTLALARTHGLAAHSESDLGEPLFKHR
jgi:predicted SprT family Zn-dependent metalloprotease